MKIGKFKMDKRYMLLFIIIILGISAVVGYSYLNSDLDYRANVTVKKPCEYDNLYNRLSCKSILDSMQSKYVSNISGINLKEISSNTNGKGLYTYSSTDGDEYPIYYYRGDISNNNVKFAGFCWKIVRTTETGGTKLIYNGEPDEDGNCTNTTEGTTQLSASKFNEAEYFKFSGYMYGNQNTALVTKPYRAIFGKSYSYSNGEYTLIDTVDTIDEYHHYTCFNDTGTCNTIQYVYNKTGIENYYFNYKMDVGQTVEQLREKMRENLYDSIIKNAIDTWFENDFLTWFTNQGKNYNDYLEDTIWCNERDYLENGSELSLSKSGWNPEGGSVDTNQSLAYSAYDRVKGDGYPLVTCPNKRDAFTVSDTERGNGALTYPVGLLTTDEVMLAGATSLYVSGGHKYYLNNNNSWWTMTPEKFNYYYHYIYIVSASGNIYDDYTKNERGIRPAISLKNSVNIASGNGEPTSPYVIE